MSATVVVCVESDAKAVEYVEALAAVRVDHEEVIVVTPERRRDDLIRLGARAEGLLLCGGPDLAPERYGEEPRPDADLYVDPDLDQMEWELLTGARLARTPVWAVCRGMQTANAFLGGTLWQDLPSQRPESDEHYVRRPLDHLAHAIEVGDRSSELGARLAAADTRVNTRHHQAIKDLAPELKEIARSPDGVIEVVESRDREWWLRGVQWHPENLLAHPLQRRLWLDFMETAVAASAGNDGETR